MFSFHSKTADALPNSVVGGHAGSFVDLQVLANNVSVSSGNFAGHGKDNSSGNFDNFEVRLPVLILSFPPPAPSLLLHLMENEAHIVAECGQC